MSSVQAKPRNELIDALKFFAIALVVLGHVANLPRYDNALGNIVYVIRAINMPMFMLLAGYVLFGHEGTSSLVFVQRKFLALMVPYFGWIAFGLVLRGAPLSQWAVELMGALVDPQGAGRKWFLYVLFVFYVLFTLVRMVSKRDVWLVVAAGATIALMLLPPGEYVGRSNTEWLFTFFVAGYLAARHRNRLPDACVWLAISAGVLFVGLLAIGWLPDAGSGWPPWFFARTSAFFAHWWRLSLPAFLLWKYATAFAGIAATVLVYALVDRRWWLWQAPAGRRSLGIYVTQGWLLVLATGSGVAAALGSWVLIIYVSLAVAILLEQTTFTRVVFLGRPAKPREVATRKPIEDTSNQNA